MVLTASIAALATLGVLILFSSCWVVEGESDGLQDRGAQDGDRATARINDDSQRASLHLLLIRMVGGVRGRDGVRECATVFLGGPMG